MLFAWVSNVSAQVPEIISYQGILSDSNGAPLTGIYNLTVRIYDEEGAEIWHESHTEVAVNGGVFNIHLGSVIPFGATVDFSIPYWLGVSINGGTELTPRTQFTSVGTALMAKRVMDGGIPAGMVAAFAMPTAPAQWLVCNGQAVSRTEYPNLFAAIGTMYGAGDGSTTFNLPDYRGYFLRGWDNGRGADPDAASRSDRGDGTAGDNIGAKQTDEFKAHTHGYRNSTGSAYGSLANGAMGGTVPTTCCPGVTFSSGANETRPLNISVLYCIKY